MIRRLVGHVCCTVDLISITGVVVLAQRQGGATPEIAISGELKQWHKVTLTLSGPQAEETSNAPNPFMDYRMTVTFTHESGSPSYVVPGYFAADGNAANTS